MKKRFTLLLVLSFLLLVVFGMSYTYSLFQSDITGKIDAEVATWLIKINGSDIVKTADHTFDPKEFNIVSNNGGRVTDNKFAPGVSGYFNLAIDASLTDVSIYYEFTVDSSVFKNSQIEVQKVVSLSGTGNNITETLLSSEKRTITEESTDEEGNAITVSKQIDVYSGIVPLAQNSEPMRLRLYLEWKNKEDGSNDEIDSGIGIQETPSLEVPVKAYFEQYFG